MLLALFGDGEYTTIQQRNSSDIADILMEGDCHKQTNIDDVGWL